MTINTAIDQLLEVEQKHGSHVAVPEEVYWKSVFPNNPMPKAMKNILPPPGFPEFFNLMAGEMKDIGLGEGLVEAFREFDQDQNGFVSAAEFRRTLTGIGGKLIDDEVDEMIREVDSDVEGQINYEEFVKFMMSR
ncbi:hypothetical protein V6N12_064620 [Hibiscus sabdariffa]|uniref:EF-hand domain-containing protein n=1 Tax=Hibiscus sabdariffa TaxID=183260 RepID=A0ABR2G6I4_9ROSI